MISSVTLSATMDNGPHALTASVTVNDDGILEFGENFTVSLDDDPPPDGVMINTMSAQTIINLGDDGMSSHMQLKVFHLEKSSQRVGGGGGEGGIANCHGIFGGRGEEATPP